ncbi:MAG: PilZ domain-containing protein [Sandaracinaceae bacterium]
MSNFSGAAQAKEARESLGKALAALQEDPNIPSDVLAVAQNIAQAVGALFEAERASSEPDGKSCVKNALGSLSQTLALLQDVRGSHAGIRTATETIAKSMSVLFPLTSAPTRQPPSMPGMTNPSVPPAAKLPSIGGETRRSSAPAFSRPSGSEATVAREHVEANLGATTESNFYVGFSGEISQGGVFVSTYNILPVGSAVQLLVTLPGNLSTEMTGQVRFVRDPMDMSAESEPGMGIAYDGLSKDSRELILRFIRKRPPMFYDE